MEYLSKLSLFSLLHLALFMGSGCNVKDKTTSDILVGHSYFKNEFTLTTTLNTSYITADTISFTLKFPKPVDVTGLPAFNVVIGSTTRLAEYVSGTGTDTLIFEYVVVAADADLDGITAGTSIILDSGESLLYDSVNNCGTGIDVPDLSSVKVNP